ncbi:trap dicarboxylate transporter- dctp subunit [Roseibium sp. TrichSKD4]|uniref:TRAP transporter substrate-binding protein n=1 Tax=Roseibium sp. TrichSKD4 TaxID=744980 RepID=UPI0001E56D08|nr:TRAP transporter substrate-binding protein [Roseibium sp. TrichSKD4]EFO30222.1 trap dicarboxylate transporter- dctp subunit [Roseibium sp. TrichSKD4]
MRFSKIATAMVASSLAFGAPAVSADTLDVHMSIPKDLTFLAESAQLMDETLRKMSGGDVGLNLFGSGELVPAGEILENVSSGAIPAGWSFLGQWGGKVPVAQIGATPFGAGPEALAAWLHIGGGLEIVQKGFDPLNVKVLACHVTNPEPGGWFNKEIKSIEDFNGLKMRMAGVGARVLNEFGASAQYLPASEIYLALERGRIDATEFSLPIIDKDLGFNQIAKYYYYPGWHQPGSVDVLMINMDVWKGMSGEDQAMYEAACQVSLGWTLQYAPAAQTPQIEEFEAGGTIVKRFPDDVLAELRIATEQVLSSEAEKDALYGEAYNSMKAFVASSGRWTALQTIPAE